MTPFKQCTMWHSWYPELFRWDGVVGYLPKYFSANVTESEQTGQGQLCNHNTVGKEPEATLKKTAVVDFQYAMVNRLSNVYQHGRHHGSGTLN
jgi:hypothetical protein